MVSLGIISWYLCDMQFGGRLHEPALVKKTGQIQNPQSDLFFHSIFCTVGAT
jgi:hypothetical protein